MVRMQLKTIRSKILLLIGAALLLAQLVVAGLSVWQEATRYSAQKQETLQAAAQVLAAASAHSVASRS